MSKGSLTGTAVGALRRLAAAQQTERLGASFSPSMPSPSCEPRGFTQKPSSGLFKNRIKVDNKSMKEENHATEMVISNSPARGAQRGWVAACCEDPATC